MTVDTNASGRWVSPEDGLGQKRSLPHYQPKDAFFTEIVKIGRYDLIYRVGSGGMATVFVARLSGLAGFERLVAVKVIHQHLADSRRFVQMFLDEARMAASIHHPNVFETYEVGREEGLFFIIGEFVPGQDLNRLLRRIEEREITLSQGMVAKIASQICFGLHAAHETRDQDGNPLNLIHRDVSPNNILISYDGYVKLIDFGVAWARNKMAQTESGALKGKIGYISPEQITGQAIDRRSDIFSVGVLAYTMATLTHPFPGDSDAERLNKIITGDMLPPSAMLPEIHPEFERIILKAMSTSPMDRYDTAAEMGRELEAFAESSGDAVKTENLAELMQTIFSEERETHETRISAYRAAIEQDKSQTGEFSEDDLFLSNTETYAEISRSGIRRPPWYGDGASRKRLIIVSALGGFVLAAAILLLIMLGRESSPSSVVKGPKEGLASSKPVSGSVSGEKGAERAAGGSEKGSSKSPSAVPLETVGAATSEKDDKTTAGDDKPVDTKSDGKSDVEPGQQRRKKTKLKKTKSDLLKNPYS